MDRTTALNNTSPMTHPAAATQHAVGPMASTIEADRLLSLLGGRLRLAILRTLSEGPSHVGGIAERVNASIGLVSHNLRQLRDAGLVTRQAKARERIYDLSPEAASRLTTGTLIRLISAEGARIEVKLPLAQPALVQTDAASAGRLLTPHSPVAKAI